MNVTLQCANCGSQESHKHGHEFKGWFILTDHSNMVNEWHICSLYCLGFLAQREEGFRRHEQQQPLEAGGWGLSGGSP